jgi:hypothetical protein
MIFWGGWMLKMKKLVLALILMLLVVPCQAKIISVDDDGPADFSSIQAAIDFAEDSDIIVVKAGTYNQNIFFNGRAVTVTSQDPDNLSVVQSTIITVSSGYSVTFDFGEGSDSVLTGFTITGRGIYCYSTAPTISKNIIRDCQGCGIYGEFGAAPIIVNNTIRSNGKAGIFQCDGPIRANTISQNALGIDSCDGPVAGNTISKNSNTNPGYGGGLSFCNGEITGNVIIDNYASSLGGGLHGCGGSISHNIIAGNKAGASGGGLYNCNEPIRNNTIVGNMAGQSGGAIRNCPGIVSNNIIAFNRASSIGGIYGLCDNSYNNFWMNEVGNVGGGATAGPGDIVTDPLFAVNGYWDTNGTTGTSDDFWVGGDYHPKSQVGRWDPSSKTWTADGVTSDCIDAGDPGSDWTGELWPHGRKINIGAYGGTAQASMSLSSVGNPADLNNDDWIGYQDLGMLVDKWQSDDVPLAEDLNKDGIVNFEDFGTLAASWQQQAVSQTPPIPNPMTWATPPHATSPYSIAMVATTAASTDGSGVEYYFEDRWYPEFNSGWISFEPGEEAMWEDVNLSPNTLYWYRVKARNTYNLIETDWSPLGSATTLREDVTPPTPNPMTWATKPYATLSTSIRMVASTASDPSGVQYYFECTSHPAYSSGWQASPEYTVTGLTTQGLYSFVVRARDTSPNYNTTLDSLLVTVDLKPPTPNPMQWATGGEPRKVYHGGGAFDYWAEMKAAEATDESGVEYRFVCSDGNFSSGGTGDDGPRWRNESNVDGDPREYKVRIGQQSYYVTFYVIARDRSPNQNATGRSSAEPWK